MAFQFKRDRGDNITLILAGDIDLEVTPEIKTQLSSQLEDAASLTIDASNISYLDSSGVSILVIAMQNSKQKQIVFSISNISDEAMRVLQLAKLEKFCPLRPSQAPRNWLILTYFLKPVRPIAPWHHKLPNRQSRKIRLPPPLTMMT